MKIKEWIQKQFKLYSAKVEAYIAEKGTGLQPPPNDGATYGYCNGEWVEICPANGNIQVQLTTSTMELKQGVKVESLKGEGDEKVD